MSIKHVLSLGLVAALVVLCQACGDSPPSAFDGGTGTDTDTDSDSDVDTDADSDSDADFGHCELSCSAPSTCIPTDPLATQNEDNWSCAPSYCEWLGCLSTAECQEAYPAVTNVVCNTGAAKPTCTLPCDDASDCVQPDKPLFNADNWACEANFCVWTGCASTEECQEAFPSTELVCATYSDPPICAPHCAVPADCVPADAVDLYDEENWACTGGACEHLGCLSTEECTGSAHGPGSICIFD